MPRKTTTKSTTPVTTAQKLGSVIKSARDIMRKDKGLSGELDRLPQLTWIMFLKLLDDVEKVREVEAELEEMRDAAGDSGEFYTPRPVVKFMVEVMKPHLGEVIFDPACGTGGFLVEVYEYLQKQCSASDWEILQNSIIGAEAKPLPYLLVQMNLLLHGFEYPDIDYGNSLRFPLSELGIKSQVDVILTNPPFGGEEEDRIQNNFPPDRKTKETALLFLQLIMKRLKKKSNNARAAVIVPNGVLYNLGVAEKIRHDLIHNFNLHTIVRLPKGVFEPYADIPTNILFFDTDFSLDYIWFYEHPLPPSRARLKTPSYSKTQPLEYKEFSDLIKWWSNKVENNNAWRVSKDVLINNHCNLDVENPNKEKYKDINLSIILEKKEKTLKEITLRFSEIKQLENDLYDLNKSNRNILWKEDNIDTLCNVEKGKYPTLKTQPGQYKLVVTAAERKTADSYQFNTQAICIPLVSSTGHGHASLHRIHYEEGKFALANIMVALLVKPNINLIPKYLYYYLWRYKDEKIVSLMSGTANTSLSISKIKTIIIEYPQDLIIQQKYVEIFDKIHDNTIEIQDLLEKSKIFNEDLWKLSLQEGFG